LVAEVADL